MSVRRRHAALRFALTIGMAMGLVVTANLASAQNRCARGYYACNINADGTLDPEHPGCCLYVPGVQRACSPGFYSCRYNATGFYDPDHPGCCLHVPGVPHVK
jgi:hypothetical protein